MTNFYEARDAEGVPRWIAAHEQTGENRMFVWLANDQSWHRNAGLEDVFYSLAPDMTFVPITAEDAAVKTLTWPKIDRKRAGWIVDELAAAPALSAAQLGVPVAPSARPTTRQTVIRELANSRGKWVTVARYTDPNKKAAATVLASEIRTGKRAKFKFVGPLATRVVIDGDEIQVQARREPKKTVIVATKAKKAVSKSRVEHK
jgi:hypothetical protein